MEPKIEFKSVDIRIPVFNVDSFSLRKAIFRKSRKPHYSHALKNINLIINAGERVGIYGHNGAGKTSLLRAIAGGYHPQSGLLKIIGNVSSMIDIGLGLDFEASGYQNIKLKLGLINAKLRNNESLISQIIEFSGLKDSIHFPIRTYSSGMVMRLAFSITTQVEADILVLDEWLSVGDSSFSQKAEARMHEMVEKSSILVIASHSQDLLRKICTRVITLDQGRIIADEPVKD